jgi:hypothetical protein
MVKFVVAIGSSVLMSPFMRKRNVSAALAADTKTLNMAPATIDATSDLVRTMIFSSQPLPGGTKRYVTSIFNYQFLPVYWHLNNTKRFVFTDYRAA